MDLLPWTCEATQRQALKTSHSSTKILAPPRDNRIRLELRPALNALLLMHDRTLVLAGGRVNAALYGSAPRGGFEPPTIALTGRRSTVDLPRIGVFALDSFYALRSAVATRSDRRTCRAAKSERHPPRATSLFRP